MLRVSAEEIYQDVKDLWEIYYKETQFYCTVIHVGSLNNAETKISNECECATLNCICIR